MSITREWRWAKWMKGGLVSLQWDAGSLASAFASFDLTEINRPHVRASWYDEEEFGVALDWGNGNSDPVWSVAFSFRPTGWLARRPW